MAPVSRKSSPSRSGDPARGARLARAARPVDRDDKWPIEGVAGQRSAGGHSVRLPGGLPVTGEAPGRAGQGRRPAPGAHQSRPGRRSARGRPTAPGSRPRGSGSCSIAMSSTLTPARPTSANSRASAPGASGMATTTCRYVTGAAAVLAGDLPGPGDRRAAAGRAAPSVDGRRPPPPDQQVRAGLRPPRSSSSTAAELAPTICSHSPGSLPAIRVTSRSPWPASTRSLVRDGRSGGRPSAPTSGAAGATPGRRPRRGRRRPWSPAGRRRPGPAATTGATEAGVGAAVRGDHPGAVDEQVGPSRRSGRSAGSRPSGAIRRSGARSTSRRQSACQHAGLDRADVGDGRPRVGLQAVHARRRRSRRAAPPRRPGRTSAATGGSMVPAPRPAATRAWLTLSIAQVHPVAAARSARSRWTRRSARCR